MMKNRGIKTLIDTVDDPIIKRNDSKVGQLKANLHHLIFLPLGLGLQHELSTLNTLCKSKQTYLIMLKFFYFRKQSQKLPIKRTKHDNLKKG